MARTKAATTGRRPLIAGNWKMNLNHLEAISVTQKIAFSLSEEQLTDVEVVVLPPFTDLRSVQTLIGGDRLLLGYGAQDLSPHDSGAYTGDVSGPMLAKLGCQYVVIGHSERRQHHAETDDVVKRRSKWPESTASHRFCASARACWCGKRMVMSSTARSNCGRHWPV